MTMTLKSIQGNYAGNSCASINQHNSQLNSTTTQNYQRIIYQRPFSYPKKSLVESSNKVDVEPAQLACHRYALWQLSADELAEKTTVFSKEHPSIKQQVKQIINAIDVNK